MTNISIIYTTYPDKKTAEKISVTLVEQNIASCVNILRESQSIYKWEGKVCVDSEIPVFIKLPTSNVSTVIYKIKELHPYDCPCIVSWDIADGNEDYIDWIRQL